MRIRPSTPLIPSSNDEASTLVCPPYDTVSTEEARAYLHLHPGSFMAVVRPEASLSSTFAPYDSSVYNAAATALERLKSSGRLVRAKEETYYVYQQRMGSHVQRGLVVLASVADYDNHVILRHEKTRPEKENDRARLTATLSANTGPVFLTYQDVPTINQLVEDIAQTLAHFEVTAEDGVCHTIWRVREGDVSKFTHLFREHVRVAYIADGHHRAASAARVARERSKSAVESNDDSNWFLSVLFPQTQLKILAYNRLVNDLNGMDTTGFLERLEAVGELHEIQAPEQSPVTRRTVFVFVNCKWYSLRLPPTKNSTPTLAARDLDADMLQRHVLAPILGVSDPRKSKKIEFVGGIRGIEYLERQVYNGAARVAFALCPVSVPQLMKVADAGETMPPKSTWFEPKLRSGFFVHTF